MMDNEEKRFMATEDSATAIAYGIMAAATAAVIVVLVKAVGTKINTAFKYHYLRYVLITIPQPWMEWDGRVLGDAGKW